MCTSRLMIVSCGREKWFLFDLFRFRHTFKHTHLFVSLRFVTSSFPPEPDGIMSTYVAYIPQTLKCFEYSPKNSTNDAQKHGIAIEMVSHQKCRFFRSKCTRTAHISSTASKHTFLGHEITLREISLRKPLISLQSVPFDTTNEM